MIIKEVVHCILTYKKNILLLKRSQNVGSQKGKWAGITGFLEELDPLEQAYKEIQEESSLSKEDVKLIKAGNSKDCPDIVFDDKTWRVYPFHFEILYPEKIQLDWEHDEMKWVAPIDIVNYDTIVDFQYLISDLLEV